MKKVTSLLVAVAGAALAIPGIAELADADVPLGAEPLFAFALVVASSASVLAVYTLRDAVTPESTKGTALFVGVVVMLVMMLFAVYRWMSAQVLVTHYWRSEPAKQFVPLLLPDSVKAAIETIGSRQAYIMEHGPDVFVDVTNEVNSTLTLLVLVGLYAVLVATVATLFTVLAIREAQPSKDDSAMEAGAE